MSKTVNVGPTLNEGTETVTAQNLWALTDPDTGRVALTTRGLLAVYTSRKAARAARERVRVANPRVRKFEG